MELERLEASFARASAGTPRIVLVGGEAGIGKTRLVEEFAGRARARGARVLTGECLGIGDGGLPFAPFVAALRELVRGVAPEDLAALLGPGRGRLGRLIPELEGPSAGDAHGLESRRRARAQLFEAVLDVLERVARQGPLVLVIENLQWADRSSLDLLSYLARVLRAGPVLIVATVRSDEIRDRQAVLVQIAELEREDNVERLELGPLGRQEVGALVALALESDPDAELVDTLLDRTDGNPFFVEQLLQARREAAAARGHDPSPADADGPATLDLPPRLRDVLLVRIAGLSAPAREVLRAAAAAGRRVDDELLAVVVDRPPREISDALREAVDRRILVAVVDPGRPRPGCRQPAGRPRLPPRAHPGGRARRAVRGGAATAARRIRDRPHGAPRWRREARRRRTDAGRARLPLGRGARLAARARGDGGGRLRRRPRLCVRRGLPARRTGAGAVGPRRRRRRADPGRPGDPPPADGRDGLAHRVPPARRGARSGGGRRDPGRHRQRPPRPLPRAAALVPVGGGRPPGGGGRPDRGRRPHARRSRDRGSRPPARAPRRPGHGGRPVRRVARRRRDRARGGPCHERPRRAGARPRGAGLGRRDAGRHGCGDRSPRRRPGRSPRRSGTWKASPSAGRPWPRSRSGSAARRWP